ncbi:hypothetical protein FHG89_10640 [Micromonospora orduensis]|uniref:Uncharacterized protein n=1 Tax=Micromonospora orduensis TaxID=1420891 RepID=A0A5C4QUM5_9ACTN|nr:hypothetical protein [Micromonospora orduensis]TNH29833.1 hypothetical protein FHG89_10640 [Micromonospora orduensis]
MASDDLSRSDEDEGGPEVAPPRNTAVARRGAAVAGDNASGMFLEAAAVWVGASAAAGVLGNAVYDALKAALGRLRRRKVATAEDDLVLFARVALDLARPALLDTDELFDREVYVSCREVRGGWRVTFYSGEETVRVRLSVDDERQDVKAKVRLRRMPVVVRRYEDEGYRQALRTANGSKPSPSADPVALQDPHREPDLGEPQATAGP